MDQFLLLPLLVGLEHYFAPLVAQENGPALRYPKSIGRDLAQIDKRQHHAIGEPRPEFLHQVKSQTRPTGPISMEKPNRRVETDGFQRTLHVMDQERIDERK